MQRILNSKSLRILQINRLNNNKIKLIRTMASKISEAEWKEKLTPKRMVEVNAEKGVSKYKLHVNKEDDEEEEEEDLEKSNTKAE